MEQPAKTDVLENDVKSEVPLQIGTSSVDALENTSPAGAVAFKPGWDFYASFTSLCIITLAVALDATSLSVALPVSPISL